MTAREAYDKGLRDGRRLQMLLILRYVRGFYGCICGEGGRKSDPREHCDWCPRKETQLIVDGLVRGLRRMK
jgi:hypothetical protein